MLFRNNPKVYLTINHGDSRSVNPRTKLSRSELRRGEGALLICLRDPICADENTTRGNWFYFKNGKPEYPNSQITHKIIFINVCSKV